jgi:hypothetical protein
MRTSKNSGLIGGASAIWIGDGHGSGNGQKLDIPIDKMDGQAYFDFRDHAYDPFSNGNCQNLSWVRGARARGRRQWNDEIHAKSSGSHLVII